LIEPGGFEIARPRAVEQGTDDLVDALVGEDRTAASAAATADSLAGRRAAKWLRSLSRKRAAPMASAWRCRSPPIWSGLVGDSMQSHRSSETLRRRTR